MVRRWTDRIATASLGLGVWLTATNAFATSTLPWAGPITTIVNDLTGPTGRGVATVAAALCGLMWANTEHGAGIRRLSAVGVGGAVAVGGANLVTLLWGAPGALI